MSKEEVVRGRVNMGIYMNIKELSKTYTVQKLEENDISGIFELCKKNPQYYRYCPPEVTKDAIKEDMTALPPNKTMKDKYYIGFFDGTKLVAVMDLIAGYPNEETAFIGFFMMDADLQGQGIGTQIIGEACDYLKDNFSKIRLGYVKGNKQSESFWLKNQFEKTGIESKQKKYTVVMMERELCCIMLNDEQLGCSM